MTKRILLAAAAALLSATSAQAADLGKAGTAAALAQTFRAVDGFNWKLDAVGGGAEGQTGGLWGARGAVSLPIGEHYGVQVDGQLASFGGRALGSSTVHLFRRDPGLGLLGLIGQYGRWDKYNGIDIGRAGVEFAWYVGRFTVEGMAGWEGGTRRDVVDPAGTTTRIDLHSRAFDKVQVGWYATDDLKLTLGHRWSGGRHAGIGSAEWAFPIGQGYSGAVFAEGSLGERGDGAVMAGVRVYWGAKDKPLIRRHREDDPILAPGIDEAINGGSVATTAAAPSAPPIPCLAPRQIVDGVCVLVRN